MKNHIERLHVLLAQIDDKMEQDNILRDIEALCRRIESHEYKNTDFLARQQLDTPRRTYEFINYFTGYYQQALQWVVMLKKIPFDKIEVVFDFCSGGGPKIQWALKQLAYRNQLLIFDKNELACQQLSLLLAILQVDYHYSFIKRDIFDLYSEQANLIAANHILDDLVLDDYCKLKKIPLCSVYDSEKLFHAVIREIPVDFDRENFCARFFQAIDLKLKEQGYLIMNHYRSVTEKALSLEEWSMWIFTLLRQVRETFVQKGYKQCDFLDDEAIGNSFFILQKRKAAHAL